MTKLHHINAGTLQAPGGPLAVCHCLLLEDPAGLALVDAGIGLLDGRDPAGRIDQRIIDIGGFRFDPADTAVRRVEGLGFKATDVRDIVLSHADPDHTGGLADFPHARVHLSAEELAAAGAGDFRYQPPQFAHGPRWVPHAAAGARDWFGLPARPVPLGFASEVLLVELFGHTLGHCGIAVRQGDRWALHVGDAYFLRVELSTDDHPVSAITATRAVDDPRRRACLDQLRRLHRDHASEVDLFGYHDSAELPGWAG